MDTKRIICPVCGNEFYAEFESDYVVKGRLGLDGNAHDTKQFNKVYMCPACGYSSAVQITNEDAEIIELVKSDKFQDVFRSEWSEGLKKWMLAGYISKASGNHYDAAYEFMVAGWYIREFGGTVDDFVYAYNMAISEFARYTEERFETKPVLIMLDLLRQIGNFEKATDIAFSLKGSEVDENAEKLIDFELKRISEMDISEHYFNEI